MALAVEAVAETTILTGSPLIPLLFVLTALLVSFLFGNVGYLFDEHPEAFPGWVALVVAALVLRLLVGHRQPAFRGVSSAVIVLADHRRARTVGCVKYIGAVKSAISPRVLTF